MDGDFNGSLVISIKETLTGLLGFKIYDALAYHLLRFHDITPEEIPYRLDAIDVVLKQNFGSSFTVIERAVLKRFYGKLGLEFVNQQGYTFHDYVEDAKRKLEHRSNAPSEAPDKFDTVGRYWSPRRGREPR